MKVLLASCQAKYILRVTLNNFFMSILVVKGLIDNASFGFVMNEKITMFCGRGMKRKRIN